MQNSSTLNPKPLLLWDQALYTPKQYTLKNKPARRYSESSDPWLRGNLRQDAQPGMMQGSDYLRDPCDDPSKNPVRTL